MEKRRVALICLILGQVGTGIIVAVSLLISDHSFAATNHAIQVGEGFTDVSPHQLIRTSTNVLYTVAPTCDVYPTCPNNTLRVYRANETDTPSSFSEQDMANRPSNVGSSAIALDSDDVIHVAWNDRSGNLKYRAFSTSTKLWSANTTTVAATGWTDFGQGDEGVAIAVDSAGTPHAVWSEKDSGGTLHLWYANRGTSWSAKQVDDDVPLGNNRRALHPTIAFKANNDLVVAWLEGTFNYKPDGIIRVRTRNANGSWPATEAINDPAMTTIDNGPSVLVTADNTIHLTFVNTNDEIRYWYYNGAWHGDTQPPTQQTHDPSLGPDGSGGILIYGHGTPTPIDGHGDNLYSFHKALGGAWGPWTLYVAGSYDSSVSTRWAQFFHAFPQTIDIAYWADSSPNILFVGTDQLGTPTPSPTPTSIASPTPSSTPSSTATSTASPIPSAIASSTPIPLPPTPPEPHGEGTSLTGRPPSPPLPRINPAIGSQGIPSPPLPRKASG